MFRKLCRRPFSTRAGRDFLVHFFQRNMPMVQAQFQKQYGCVTFTFQRVIAKSGEDGSAPLAEAKGRTHLEFHFIGQSGKEGIAQVGSVEGTFWFG